MGDEPESILLRYMRRLDERMERLQEDTREVKHRLTTLENQIGQMMATEQSHYASMMARHDQSERRLERIDRRLDLAETPA